MKLKRACHAVALSADPPEWVMLLPAGEFSGRDGRGPYRTDAESIIAAFGEWGMPLHGDYNHQAIRADEKAGPVPASGWVQELEEREGAIWGRVEWTQAAAAHISAKEYRYLSPVFSYDPADSRVVALSGFGLTNDPNLYLSAIHGRQSDTYEQTEETAMSLMDDLRWVLNLPATATESEIAAELDKAKAMITGMGETAMSLETDARLPAILEAVAQYQPPGPEVRTLLQEREPDLSQYVPKAQYDQTAQALHALQQQQHRAQVDALVTAGKLAPAQKDWALAYASRDPEGFAQFAAAAPVIVSGEAHGQTPPAGEDDEDLVAARIAGVDPKDLK